MSTLSHPDEVVAITNRILEGSPAQGRVISVGRWQRIHIIEAGEGPPLVLLHGGGTSALQMLPLIERLNGVRAITPDRPGFGLSEPAAGPNVELRERAIEFVDTLLDALGLDQVSLAGNSMGGVWALWYAMTHPDRIRRLVLVGSAPLLPGTSAPFPLRIMTTPFVGELMGRLPTNRDMVVRIMGFFGEGETIVNYPEQVEALVAAGNDAVASRVDLHETRALLTPFGFRRAAQFKTDELAQLPSPTLVLWGEQDPIGRIAAAKTVAQAIPNAELELLPAGHMPWLAAPDRTAELVSNFVR